VRMQPSLPSTLSMDVGRGKEGVLGYDSHLLICGTCILYRSGNTPTFVGIKSPIPPTRTSLVTHVYKLYSVQLSKGAGTIGRLPKDTKLSCVVL